MLNADMPRPKKVEDRPLWLVAELSHRCPLKCPYCSNPATLSQAHSELDTEGWFRVFEDARKLGAVQLGFTGGEPLVRKDIVELVQKANELGYYTNLITSGVGLRPKMKDLKVAGLDHVQISFQAAEAARNDQIAGAVSYHRKKEACNLVKEMEMTLGVNFVVHRLNIDQTADMLQFAEELGADYVEFANVQFEGWAEKNKMSLLPTLEQIQSSSEQVERFKQTSDLTVYYVVPDYFEGSPKPCGRGWGSTQLVVDPEGTFLPCLGAAKLPLSFPSAKTHSVEEAWNSPAFWAYRGDGWMKEPCRSCPLKEEDFGGCRCQAFALTGDASNTDPACSRSPHHALVKNFVSDRLRNDHFTPRSERP